MTRFNTRLLLLFIVSMATLLSLGCATSRFSGGDLATWKYREAIRDTLEDGRPVRLAVPRVAKGFLHSTNGSEPRPSSGIARLGNVWRKDAISKLQEEFSSYDGFRIVSSGAGSEASVTTHLESATEGEATHALIVRGKSEFRSWVILAGQQTVAKYTYTFELFELRTGTLVAADELVRRSDTNDKSDYQLNGRFVASAGYLEFYDHEPERRSDYDNDILFADNYALEPFRLNYIETVGDLLSGDDVVKLLVVAQDEDFRSSKSYSDPSLTDEMVNNPELADSARANAVGQLSEIFGADVNFEIVQRDKLAQIMSEQRLQLQLSDDPIAVGELAGATHMLFLEESFDGREIGNTTHATNRKTSTLIDVRRGTILSKDVVIATLQGNSDVSMTHNGREIIEVGGEGYYYAP